MFPTQLRKVPGNGIADHVRVGEFWIPLRVLAVLVLCLSLEKFAVLWLLIRLLLDQVACATVIRNGDGDNAAGFSLSNLGCLGLVKRHVGKEGADDPS